MILSECVLSVRQSLEEVSAKLALKKPKTKKSRRVAQLDPIAVEALTNRFEKAKAERFEPNEVPLVFPNTQGGFVRQSNFDRRCWHPTRDAAGLRGCRFHDLRHTQASLMLHAKVDMKVIQERLGHASYATKANLYSHLTQDAQANAVGKLASLFDPERAEV